MKILSLIFLTTITLGVFIGCNSNSSKDKSETNFSDKEAVQSDSLNNDTIYTHRGIQENNSEVKK